MVDDKLIKKLKAFIKKNYQLAEQTETEELPDVSPRNRRRKTSIPSSSPFGNAFQGMQKTSSSTFEDIANSLVSFISAERKKETFSTLLEKKRKEKEMTAAQLYNGAWVKKQLYSKIMGDRNYHPSKNTVIAFGLSLKLNREEMDELLESAGYIFNIRSISDLVIIFCLKHNRYDLHDVNALLISVDQKVLCRE